MSTPTIDVIGLGAAEYGSRRDFVLQVERRYLQALQRMADDPREDNFEERTFVSRKVNYVNIPRCAKVFSFRRSTWSQHTEDRPSACELCAKAFFSGKT